jgi:hypothetical protein
MANEGENGLSGKTKPNRGTETATFIDLHGSPLFLTRDLAARRVEDLIKTTRQRIWDCRGGAT